MYDNSRKFREPSKLYFSSCNYYIIFLIFLISSLKNAFFTINYSFGDFTSEFHFVFTIFEGMRKNSTSHVLISVLHVCCEAWNVLQFCFNVTSPFKRTYASLMMLIVMT